MKGYKTTFKARIKKTIFKIKNFEGFKFNNGKKRYRNHSKYFFSKKFEEQLDSIIDYKGDCKILIKVTEKEKLNKIPIELTIVSEIKNENEIYITNSKTCIIHPCEYYIGFKNSNFEKKKDEDEYYGEKKFSNLELDKKNTIEFAVIDTNFNLIENIDINLNFSLFNSLNNEKKIIISKNLVSKKEILKFDFYFDEDTKKKIKDNKNDNILMEALVKDKNGNIISVSNCFKILNNDENDDIIKKEVEIILDKKNYNIGENCEIKIISPVKDEKIEGLLIIDSHNKVISNEKFNFINEKKFNFKIQKEFDSNLKGCVYIIGKENNLKNKTIIDDIIINEKKKENKIEINENNIIKTENKIFENKIIEKKDNTKKIKSFYSKKYFEIEILKNFTKLNIELKPKYQFLQKKQNEIEIIIKNFENKPVKSNLLLYAVDSLLIEKQKKNSYLNLNDSFINPIDAFYKNYNCNYYNNSQEKFSRNLINNNKNNFFKNDLNLNYNFELKNFIKQPSGNYLFGSNPYYENDKLEDEEEKINKTSFIDSVVKIVSGNFGEKKKIYDEGDNILRMKSKKDFCPILFYKEITTDENGKANFKFDVKNNETEYNFYCISSKGNLFGIAENFMINKFPIEIK